MTHNADYERLVGEVATRLMMGQQILPFPELPQDFAYIAFILDALRGFRPERQNVSYESHEPG